MYEKIRKRLMLHYNNVISATSPMWETSLDEILRRIAWAKRFKKINDEEYHTLVKMFLGIVKKDIDYDFETNECYYTDNWQKVVF